MPGMMDTILNLGLNDETVVGLAKQTGDERFTYDCYRRFIQLFSKIAMQADAEKFDKKFEMLRDRSGAKFDTRISQQRL